MRYENEIKIGNQKVEFSRLSQEVDEFYDLRVKDRSLNVVGNVHQSKLRFKINQLNFYPFLPVAIFEQSNQQSLQVSVFYDKKSKIMQTFFLGFPLLFFIATFVFVIYYLSHEWGNVSPIIFAVLFISLISVTVFATFIYIRRSVWQQTVNQVNELIKKLGY